jgi:ATP-dependent Clp protease ATP-binding subunit ClpA
MLGELAGRLSSLEIAVEFTPACVSALAHTAGGEEYGARPLRREIQSRVETPIAQRILEGEVAAGDSITIDLDEAGLADCRILKHEPADSIMNL